MFFFFPTPLTSLHFTSIYFTLKWLYFAYHLFSWINKFTLEYKNIKWYNTPFNKSERGLLSFLLELAFRKGIIISIYNNSLCVDAKWPKSAKNTTLRYFYIICLRHFKSPLWNRNRGEGWKTCDFWYFSGWVRVRVRPQESLPKWLLLASRLWMLIY